MTEGRSGDLSDYSQILHAKPAAFIGPNLLNIPASLRRQCGETRQSVLVAVFRDDGFARAEMYGVTGNIDSLVLKAA